MTLKNRIKRLEEEVATVPTIDPEDLPPIIITWEENQTPEFMAEQARRRALWKAADVDWTKTKIVVNWDSPEDVQNHDKT